MVANSAQTGMVVVSIAVEIVVAMVVIVTLVETVVVCVCVSIFISNSVVVESVDSMETAVECCGSCADF